MTLDVVRFVVKHGTEARMYELSARSQCNLLFFTCTLWGRYPRLMHIVITVFILPQAFLCLSAEFMHRVRCAFELIKVRENILTIPGFQISLLAVIFHE